MARAKKVCDLRRGDVIADRNGQWRVTEIDIVSSSWVVVKATHIRSGYQGDRVTSLTDWFELAT
ncbi:hypothetical protein GCM10010470_09200 [Saccharopolyspora taberi]|uniref:Uncharacterized protein n=2 Tax=Saccharopolyspora taberi TaxID=60895 RepID=A0ABN3V4I9_9PSEU